MRISDWSSDVCSSDLCRSPDRQWWPDHSIAVPHTEAGQGRSFPDIRPVEAVRHRQPAERNGRSKDIGVCEHPESGECRRLLLEPPVPCARSEEHTSELQSLMRISYAVFCLKKKTQHYTTISP